MLKTKLQQLGFSREEANVYTVLLRIGGGGASHIAKMAGSHRVTTYNTLKKLEKRGFLRKSKKNGVLFYIPEDPGKILKEAEDTYRLAKGLVPNLLALRNKHKFKPHIRFLDGKSEVVEIFHDMLESKMEIVGFVNFRALQQLYPTYLANFFDESLKKAISLRFLCPNDKFHEEYFANNFLHLAEKGLLTVFAVDPNKFAFKNAQFIYDKKVSILSFDRFEPVAVITESITNAFTNRAVFDLAWLGATRFAAK